MVAAYLRNLEKLRIQKLLEKCHGSAMDALAVSLLGDSIVA